MNISTIHPNFKLNGISFSKETLKDMAYYFIKEGEPFEKFVGHFLSDWLDDSPTVAVNTSGSTGTPKPIVLQKYHMVNSALATGNFFDLRPGNSALLCLSADYIAGKMMLVRAMVLGLDLNCIAPSSNPLEESDKVYDFGAMVPMQLQHSLDKIDKIKKLIVGGAPISFSLKQKLGGVKSKVFETYGMTETITHIAVKEIDTSRLNARQTDIVGVETLEGNPFNALHDITLSTDNRNCLVIDAPKISNKRIITNDVVSLTSSTTFEWLGRYDNVINSGGVKLHPELIEGKLAPLIAQRFFVAGIQDTILGQKLILVVEGENDVKKLLEDIAALSSIKKYEIPKEAFLLPYFVETDTGKIKRTETLGLIEL